MAGASQGQGLGSEALHLLARYLFDERGHHRLTIDPAAANKRAIRAYERVGFRPVGVMREYERGSDGRWARRPAHGPARTRAPRAVTTIDIDDPLAVAAVEAIHGGDLPRLKRLLAEHPELAAARLGDDDPDGMSRTLLHVATDWPGHFPNGPAAVALLVEAGADVNARFRGPHAETQLHWAASSDDVAVLDALLDAGADIEAPGAVLGGGPPLADATGFGQWQAAHRLVERGAQTTLSDAATLGLMDRLERYFARDTPRPRRRSPAPSGAPATAGNGARPSISSTEAPS